MVLQFQILATYLRAKFGESERGASLVEYALLVALIAVICIVGITLIGREANSTFNDIGSKL